MCPAWSCRASWAPSPSPATAPTGAPFYRLNELHKDDRILIVTKGWLFASTVSRTQVVRPTDTWVLDDAPGPDGKPKATITLTTCHPRYSARQRLIVFGDLTSTIPKRGAAAAA